MNEYYIAKKFSNISTSNFPFMIRSNIRSDGFEIDSFKGSYINFISDPECTISFNSLFRYSDSNFFVKSLNKIKEIFDFNSDHPYHFSSFEMVNACDMINYWDQYNKKALFFLSKVFNRVK